MKTSLRFRKNNTLVFIFIEVFFIAICLNKPAVALAADPKGSPINLSPNIENANSPVVVTDGQGLVYAGFIGSDLTGQKDSHVWGKYQNVYLQPLAVNATPPLAGPFNVAVSPTGTNPFVILQADNKQNILHMLFRSQGSLFYQQAPLNKATGAAEYSIARNLDDYSLTYSASLVIDSKGIIHAAWSQQISDTLTNQQFAIMYRQSNDQGKTWSFPKEIGQSKFKDGQVTLKLDRKDGLYLAWEDIDANQPDQIGATFGIFARSLDGGETWNKPRILNSADTPIYHLAITPFGNSGTNLLAVWRNQDRQQLEFIVSTDQGLTWTKPQVVTGVFLPPLTNEYDPNEFILGADNYGRVQLVVKGTSTLARKFEDLAIADLAIYLSTWQNNTWKTPEVILPSPGYTEGLTMALGLDRLHLIWTERDETVKEKPGSIRYSSIYYDSGFTAKDGALPAAPTQTPKPEGTTSEIGNLQATLENEKTLQVTLVAPISPLATGEEPNEWIKDSYFATGLALVPILSGFIVLGIFARIRRVRRKIKK